MTRQLGLPSGIRKQSVEDVERLFSLPLMDWMEKKGYSNEALCLRAGGHMLAMSED